MKNKRALLGDFLHMHLGDRLQKKFEIGPVAESGWRILAKAPPKLKKNFFMKIFFCFPNFYYTILGQKKRFQGVKSDYIKIKCEKMKTIFFALQTEKLRVRHANVHDVPPNNVIYKIKVFLMSLDTGLTLCKFSW